MFISTSSTIKLNLFWRTIPGALKVVQVRKGIQRRRNRQAGPNRETERQTEQNRQAGHKLIGQ